jgi:molybdopterin converting factor small subunit
MRITARLHGTLRKYLPKVSEGNVTVVEVPDDATVADVVERLSIPRDHARMFVSGDEQLDASSVLHDGQELNLFPPLAGGL